MDYEEMKAHVNRELKQQFRPEFLNRVDDLIVFPQLTRAEVRKMVGLVVARGAAGVSPTARAVAVSSRRTNGDTRAVTRCPIMWASSSWNSAGAADAPPSDDAPSEAPPPDDAPSDALPPDTPPSEPDPSPPRHAARSAPAAVNAETDTNERRCTAVPLIIIIRCEISRL